MIWTASRQLHWGQSPWIQASTTALEVLKGQNKGTHVISVGVSLLCTSQTVAEEWLKWLTQDHIKEGAERCLDTSSHFWSWTVLVAWLEPPQELASPGTGVFHFAKRWGWPTGLVGRVRLWFYGALCQIICPKNILWVSLLSFLETVVSTRLWGNLKMEVTCVFGPELESR